MVLFLFVITLLGVREYELFDDSHVMQRAGAAALCVLLLGGVIYFVSRSGTGLTGVVGQYGHTVARSGNVQAFGHELFNTYLLPFEITPFLLVVAMVGTVALGKARKPN